MTGTKPGVGGWSTCNVKGGRRFVRNGKDEAAWGAWAKSGHALSVHIGSGGLPFC